MLAKVQKWGNSFAVRLPMTILKEIGLPPDASVNISVEDHRIVLEPVIKYDLETMLSQVTEENIHNEVDFGKPVGKELL